MIHAVGVKLLLTIPSERDTIQIEIPTIKWKTSEAKKRKLLGSNNGSIAVGIFEEVLPAKEFIDVKIRIIEDNDRVL